ncbi:hypothetical protein V9T40_001306 [Parthenolecanium corni]|uniref:Uncharacterized protein n=1 Tax=Parthenolecanium corni TaxID=536013 RepID=A0AAN9Y1A7_9HEMI
MSCSMPNLNMFDMLELEEMMQPLPPPQQASKPSENEICPATPQPPPFEPVLFDFDAILPPLEPVIIDFDTILPLTEPINFPVLLPDETIPPPPPSPQPSFEYLLSLADNLYLSYDDDDDDDDSSEEEDVEVVPPPPMELAPDMPPLPSDLAPPPPLSPLPVPSPTVKFVKRATPAAPPKITRERILASSPAMKVIKEPEKKTKQSTQNKVCD